MDILNKTKANFHVELYKRIGQMVILKTSFTMESQIYYRWWLTPSAKKFMSKTILIAVSLSIKSF